MIVGRNSVGLDDHFEITEKTCNLFDGKGVVDGVQGTDVTKAEQLGESVPKGGLHRGVPKSEDLGGQGRARGDEFVKGCLVVQEQEVTSEGRVGRRRNGRVMVGQDGRRRAVGRLAEKMTDRAMRGAEETSETCGRRGSARTRAGRGGLGRAVAGKGEQGATGRELGLGQRNVVFA